MMKLYIGLSKLNNGKNIYKNKNLENINIDDAKKDPDMFALKVLWVLHYWLSPTGKYMRKNVFGKKEMSRFTTKDSQETFLFMGSTMQAVQDHMDFIQGECI
ncbi:uncharacterized protein LOC124419841 [Lucilia cuprina]|uniref:uncharacterized protein LOC124419841 n=1 Tax=Lucilia cuprina TaxID=7375 RepID=UPI001F05DB95|nr:uncharacterized protein LOC124419841 [Lucilia cuprina]